MAYFKINGTDYSMYVNKLNVDKKTNYSAQTNANGDSVVDYISAKRTIEVGIIPLDGPTMLALQNAVDGFDVSISFRNPLTNALEEGVRCIIPDRNVEYYTIQDSKTMFNAFKLKFIEL